MLANFEGYVSLLKGAAGGNEALRAIYDEVRGGAVRADLPRGPAQGELIADTPHNRLVVRGWSAMTEELVVAWGTDPAGVTREELLDIIAGALPALVGVAARGPAPA